MQRKPYYFQMPITVQESKGASLITLERKSDEAVLLDQPIYIEGKASTSDLDRGNDIILSTAFDKTLNTYMKNPVVLLQHRDEWLIGRGTSASTDSIGLNFSAAILFDINGCAEQIRNGVYSAFSIGFYIKSYDIQNKYGQIVCTERGLEPWFDWDDSCDGDNIRIIKDIELLEISVVSIPMNQNAIFTLKKSIKSWWASEMKIIKGDTIGTGDLPENEQTEKACKPKKDCDEGCECPECREEDEKTASEKDAPTIDPKTEDETKSGETPPTPSVEDSKARDTSEPVEVGENHTVEVGEETEVAAVTLDEVKSLISEAIEGEIANFRGDMESLRKSVRELAGINGQITKAIDQLTGRYETLEASHKSLESDMLKIEIPRKGAFHRKSVENTITYDDVLRKRTF